MPPKKVALPNKKGSTVIPEVRSSHKLDLYKLNFLQDYSCNEIY